MKPEELIELYALEEAIDYVSKGLDCDSVSDTLNELFITKVRDSGIDEDQYKTLKEGYKNPQKKKIEDLPPSPFPWVASAGQGSFS
jgi:hypothetical protein